MNPRGREPQWPTQSHRCHTPTTRSSRTSTRRRWNSTTTSTTRPTWTRPTRRSRARSGLTSRSRRFCRTSTALGDKKGPVKNNGGGHYNHSLFWESMSPDGGGEPSGALGDAIASAFGSFSDFQAKLKETGVNQFGSGWAWLVHDGSGLAVVGSANQDSPISRRQDAAARRRRVGALLLPQVPEPPPGLHRRVVERGRLESASRSGSRPRR